MVALGALLGAIVGVLAASKGKTQTIRLVDVLVLGPVMVTAAAVAGRLPPLARFGLAFAGGATVTFNARNFLVERGS